MRKILLFACLLAVSCGSQTGLLSVAELEKQGLPPLEFLSITKANNPTSITYEIQLQSKTSDVIISFDYSIVKFDNGGWVGTEDKAFGGNNTVAPGEQFGFLARLNEDAPEVRFLLKSVSWKDSTTNALFNWSNREYEDKLREMKLGSEK